MSKMTILAAGTLILSLVAFSGTAAQGGDSFHEGKRMYAAGDFDGAIAQFRKAVESDENDSMCRTWLGRAYIAKLQTVSFFERGVLSGRALEQLQVAIKLDPTNVAARTTLAGYYLNAPSIAGGSKSKAREQAEEIIKYDEVQGNWILSGVLVKEGQYDEAVNKLETCVEAQPDNIEYRYRLAMLYQELELYDSAFVEFEDLLRIDPMAAGALYHIGRTAAFSRTNLDRGIECLQKYVTLPVVPGHPGYDAAHWRMGMLYEHKGDVSRARAEYESALTLNPNDSKYRDALNELAKE